jgi:hypothetical protein
VASTKARVLEEKITSLAQSFMAIWDLAENERTTAFARYEGPPGFELPKGSPHAMIGVTVRLSQMKQALEDARFNRWPVAYYPLDHVDGEIFDIGDWKDLLFLAEKTFITRERIYANMTSPDGNCSNWKDLQPLELVELLDQIRNDGK